jgi:aconitate hydratase
MTCIGSSGPLESHVETMVDAGLQGAGVLSGNRNFEGRVQPKMAAGYLASPPLVVAYALLGTIMRDIRESPLGTDANGAPVYLRDIWPDDTEVEALVREHVRPEFFTRRNKTQWLGTQHWQKLAARGGVRFGWNSCLYLCAAAVYERRHPRAAGVPCHKRRADIAGSWRQRYNRPYFAGGSHPGGKRGRTVVARTRRSARRPQSILTRRSNHEVMLRGAFTTRNLRNPLLGDAHPQQAGAYAWTADRQRMLPVYEAAQTYLAAKIPLIIFAGINYGAGSSRDWAAKAPALLGSVRLLLEASSASTAATLSAWNLPA